MIRLQERTQALFQAPDAAYGSQLRFFVSWLESEPLLGTTLLTLPEVALEAGQWIEQNVSYGGTLSLSANEDEAIGERWHVVKHVVAQDDVDNTVFQIAVNLVTGSHLNQTDYNRGFLELFIDPILTWLRDLILQDDLILHSLDRYAREAAWFRRDELRSWYEEDTSKGEATLDTDLRHHLFREGVDYPFSQTPTPTGRPDIVVLDTEADPLPLEVKVYDPPKNRDRNWIRSGFSQAIDYAHDYKRADGYLAVFDVSGPGLAVEGDDPSSRIPHVRASGVTVFVVTIPIGATAAASRRKVQREALDPDFLR